MAYSALIVESGIHPRKTANPEPRDSRSGSPRELLASPWLNRCSYYRVSSDFDSGEAWRNLETQLLGQQGKKSVPTM